MPGGMWPGPPEAVQVQRSGRIQEHLGVGPQNVLQGWMGWGAVRGRRKQ